MNCTQARPILEAYADGELNAALIMELEQHMKDCATCSTELQNLRAMKKALKQESLYFTAPDALRRRIRAELPASKKPESSRWSWNWLALSLSGAMAACLALLLTLNAARPTREQQLANEIVSGHVRSLLANHVMDVASTDQHTVKPWFNGKLDFAPPVKDLAAQQFPLIGGRLDYLDGRTVSALVFQRQKHFINLFIWPTKSADAQPAAFAANQGYHLIHWSQAGMTFWAVSDLNEKELLEFAQSYAASTTER